MKRLLLFFLTLLVIQLGAQDYSYEKHMDPNDSILMANLPKLILPDSYKAAKGKNLPDYHNNSEHPYFRPIFNQYGWSCGQASTIGYAFTYELNRARNTDASLPENQYPPLYTFNFFNGGEDGVGVCYLHTLDAIKHNGNPNIIDYNGMGESLKHWTSGYETYYNGMFNKIDEVYAIDVKDEEGLLTLKNYLYDHLEGSPYGGVVNFYTDLYSYTTLPAGTPEEGKSVITAFGSYTGHAMTFLGWNDSIRWDYNNDGQYTNDLDINGDGEVTVKDWEIGGVILANSWGDDWADSGFCYVMYNVLAQEKFDGGIWNKQVNVIKVKEEYEPQLTFKVKLTHDSRNKLKIVAGVAADTSKAIPEHLLELPVFNYQGGDNYMQGNNAGNEDKTIEFGLDVTPLLSYVESGEPARFFLQVRENDPLNLATGSVNAFSLMDYTNTMLEVACSETDLPIIENNLTSLSVVHSAVWDKLSIVEEELPPFTAGEPYSTSFTAQGGTPPYTWSLAPVYSGSTYEEDYPQVSGQQIVPIDNHWGYATQALEFPFPFYDKLVDTVYMYVDGFLSFHQLLYPLPYQVEDLTTFRNEPMIAAFMNKDMLVNTASGNKLYYAGDETYAAFRWESQIIVNGVYCPVDITAFLFPDGTIEIYHKDYIFPDHSGRITGLSTGDSRNYLISGETFAAFLDEAEKFVFTPQNYPAQSAISEEGVFSFDPPADNKIYSVSIRATDYLNVAALKTFQLSNGLIYDYSMLSGNDNQIDYGEITILSFSIKNTGTEALSGLYMTCETDDPFVSWIDNSESIGTINPGESMVLTDALVFEMSSLYPDDHNFTLNLFFNESVKDWESRINLKAYAPNIVSGQPLVDDGDNGRLDPGETANVLIPLMNTGHAPVNNVSAVLNTFDTLLTINNNSGELFFGTIPSGGMVYDTVNITVHENAPGGHTVDFSLDIVADPDLMIADSLSMLIGRYPVFIADLDPELLSGPIMKQSLEELGILHFYNYYIPNKLENFQNIFVVLGRNFGQHILTETEGEKLAGFLEEGGNIYMEGGLTWFDDPQTAVHPMFSLEPQYLGWKQIDSVYGMEGTFLDGLYFDYIGDAMYYNYHLLPLGTSYSILHASEEDHHFAIAQVAEGYKTIGSILDFGAFINGPVPSTRNHLMARYLEFFDVDVTITAVEETGVVNNGFRLMPNPVNDRITVSFQLDKAEEVTIEVYNINGSLKTSLAREKRFSRGLHQIEHRLGDFPAGIYFCSFRTAEKLETIKLIKTK